MAAALHGEYRQDKRALRGARASAAGDRDEDWQAEAEANLDDGDGSGRNANAITLSSLPRGYWATLFNLEVVKARNRPIQPPKKPEAAPFFLATVHKGGEVEPSFADMGAAAGAPAGRADGKGKAAPLPGDGGEDVPDLPSGGVDAWSDDDDNDDNDGAQEGGETGDGTGTTAAAVGEKRRLDGKDAGALDAVPPLAAAAPKSKILKQIKTSARLGGSGPSRCKLADLLLECEGAADAVSVDQDGDDDGEDEMDDEEKEGHGEKVKFGGVMTYLKTLAPPMVDVDMSLLCQGDWDEEGVHLVGLTIQFLLEELR